MKSPVYYIWIQTTIEDVDSVFEKINHFECKYGQKAEGIVLEVVNFEMSSPSLNVLASVVKRCFCPVFLKQEIVHISDFEQIKFTGIAGVILQEVLFQNPMLSEMLFERFGQEYLSSWVVTSTSKEGYFIRLNEGKITQKRVSSWLTQVDQLAVNCVFMQIEDRQSLPILKYATSAVSVPVVVVLQDTSIEEIGIIFEQLSPAAVLLKY